MKVVVNRNNNFFDLSVLAIKRIAELNGIKCYFFRDWYTGETGIYEYKPIVLVNSDSTFQYHAFTVNNPNDYICKDYNDDEAMERENSIYMDNLWYNRSNPILIQVIEELGEKASTVYSKLEIIEIPDGVEYEIENEGTGYEYIHEKHRIW